MAEKQQVAERDNRAPAVSTDPASMRVPSRELDAFSDNPDGAEEA
jgi:hypothetical protein